MSASSTLSRNILANAFGHLVNVIVLFQLTPYVVAALGNEMAGLWSAIVSLVGTYGFLDLGIRSAVAYYVAAHWARRDMDGVNRTLSTALALLGAVALVAAALTLGLWLAITQHPEWFERWLAGLPPPLLPDVRAALILMGLAFAANFPLLVFNSVLYATQRHGVMNAIGVTLTVLRALATVLALRHGFGVLGVATATVLSMALGWLATLVAAYRVVPGLHLHPWRPSRHELQPLFRYGFFNSLVNIGDIVLVHTANLVIVTVLPLAALATYTPLTAVTYYNFGAILIPHTMSLITAVTWSFTPYVTACYATGDFPALRRLILGGSRCILALGTLLAMGFLLLGHDFIRLWAGAEYVAGETYPSSAAILGILAVALFLRAKQSCNRQVLFGTNKVRFLGYLSLAEVVVNLTLSVILCRRMGPLGVALATLVAVFLTQAVAQPWYVSRRLGVPLLGFWQGAARGALPVALTMAGLHLLLRGWWPRDSWLAFFGYCAALSAPAAAAVLFVTLTGGEREHLWRRLFGRAAGVEVR